MDRIQLMEETLQKAQGLTKDALYDPKVMKAITTATGLTGLILEAPSKQLVPFMSPFRQRIPRKTQPGADAVQWKAITAVVQNAKFSTTESAAANTVTTTVASKSATFKEVGVRDGVSRKAISHGVGFEDVKAKAVTNALLLAMKLEEQAILGGNITALAAPGAPTIAVIDAGGTVPAAASGYDVRIRAITLMGMGRIVADRPAPINTQSAPFNATDALLAGNGRGGADPNPANDGWSAQGTLATSAAAAGNNDALRITWAPVNGAAGYAVYVIANGGTPKLEAIVTQCNVTLTSLAGTGINIVAGDSSADANIFDGIIAKMFADASAYKKNVADRLHGANGEIREIQDAMAAVWDLAKIDEFDILAAGIDARTMTGLTIAAGGGPTILVNPEGGSTDRLSLGQGYHVGSIVNAQTGQKCNVQVLPWLPGGMIIGLPTRIPYPSANIETPFEIAASYGWEQIDYAITTGGGPVQEFDIRADEVLKDYFPAGCWLLHNIHFS